MGGKGAKRVSDTRDGLRVSGAARLGGWERCHFRRGGGGDALGAGKLPGRLPICEGPTGNCLRPSLRPTPPWPPWNIWKMLSRGVAIARHPSAVREGDEKKNVSSRRATSERNAGSRAACGRRARRIRSRKRSIRSRETLAREHLRRDRAVATTRVWCPEGRLGIALLSRGRSRCAIASVDFGARVVTG